MSKRPDDQLQAAFDAARAEAGHMPSADVQVRARAQFLSEARGESVSPNGVVRLTEQECALPDLTVREEKQRMSRKTLRFFRLAAAALLGVIVVSGLLWASPSLRALAQEIINFIVQGESDEQSGVFFVGGDPDGSEDGSENAYVNPYTLTLEEVVAAADFDVRVPTFMLRSFRLAGGAYYSNTATAEIQYECVYPPWSLLITQQQGENSTPSQEVGASAVIEEVPIRDTVGQYVRGFWQVRVDEEVRHEREAEAREQNEAVGIPATMVWSNEVDYQQLFWREDDISYSIRTSGGSMSIDHPNPCELTKEDYAAIAEGLKPASEVYP